MKKIEEKKFNIPKLKGISEKNLEEHLKLYSGYVKNSNLILEKIDELSKDQEKNQYLISEIQRRFSFEYNGIKNHELYFEQFEGGAKELAENSRLKRAINDEWGNFELWLSKFKDLASTRGIGWAMLYYENKSGRLFNIWVDEQHLGHLSGLKPVLGIDMWEHSYVYDYQPSGKKTYIEDFFTNLNWQVIENRVQNS